jgi:hypothetical protein
MKFSSFWSSFLLQAKTVFSGSVANAAEVFIIFSNQEICTCVLIHVTKSHYLSTEKFIWHMLNCFFSLLPGLQRIWYSILCISPLCRPYPIRRGDFYLLLLYSVTKLLNDLTINPKKKFLYLNRKKSSIWSIHKSCCLYRLCLKPDDRKEQGGGWGFVGMFGLVEW